MFKEKLMPNATVPELITVLAVCFNIFLFPLLSQIYSFNKGGQRYMERDSGLRFEKSAFRWGSD